MRRTRFLSASLLFFDSEDKVAGVVLVDSGSDMHCDYHAAALL